MVADDGQTDELKAQGLRQAAEAAAQAGDLRRSAQLLGQALALCPDDAQLLTQLGGVFYQLRLDKFAVLHLDRAIELQPDCAMAINQRGLALARLQQDAAALADFRRAVEIAPSFAQAHLNLGNALSLAGDSAAAMRCYDRAVACEPELAEAHLSRAVLLLSRGDFASGWPAYEWRAKTKKWGLTGLSPIKTRWQGRASTGRLLVLREQGLGEHILFASVLEELTALVPDVTVALDERLVTLFGRSIPCVKFVNKSGFVGADSFDEQVLIGSLPQYFRRSLADFERAPPRYLFSDPRQTADLRSRLARPGRLLCGLSWSSRNAYLGSNKSASLQQLLPILRLPHVDFIDLQYGDTAQERTQLERESGIRIHKLDEIDNLNDVDALASLIRACDLVVTTSNTTAHLAGALGQPSLLLAPLGKQTIWYWKVVNGRCLWYPSIRVFEQHSHRDWTKCVEEVRSAVEAARNALL